MPLTPKGKKIKKAMRGTYKSEKKATSVFYASKKKGTITAVCKRGKH